VETERPSLTEDQLTQRDEDIPIGVHLGRIAREMSAMRGMLTEVVRYMKDAEAEVPEYMRRFIMYMHDMHDVKHLYDEHGLDVPKHVLRAVEFCDDRLRILLERLHSPGGAFAKTRADTAKHHERNRWDHTKRLEHLPPTETPDETRPSNDQPNGIDKAGADFPRG
jgi:hypothetical protein